MGGAETNTRACEDTQELSFSIRRILQSNEASSETEGNATNDTLQASEGEVIDAHRNQQKCKKSGREHKDTYAVFPWQIFGKQTNRRIGHPYQSRATPKRKKPRTTFSRSQIAELEELFNEKKYLTSSERQRVASYLQLTDCQVKTWFQNRRTKWKRETDEEKEEQRHALRRAMISFHKEVLPCQDCL